MAIENNEFNTENAMMNFALLASNPYPGRGIVLGRSSDGEQAVQAYWVMGRSENSRNRVLVRDSDDTVKTRAHDESKVSDPSLIIYNAMLSVREAYGLDDVHIVSNGDQTDTVWDRIVNPYDYDHGDEILTFQNALTGREFEPDEPNYTPRITGMIAIGGVNPYAYSIIRRNPTSGRPEHMFGRGNLDDVPEGFGLCFHTYEKDGNPLPSFKGSPYAVPVERTAEETAEAFWPYLDGKNRVGIAVKTVNLKTGQANIAIKNQLN